MIAIDFVLFDMDGLLLDTESVYTQVTQDIIGRFGYKFDWSLKQEMMGKKEEEAAQILIQTLGISMTVDEYLKERNLGHKEKFPYCKPLPGVLETVTRLHQLKVPMGIATSSHVEAFKLKTLNNQHLIKYFDSVTCGDECSRSKPFPDIFIKAAQKINPDFNPSKVLVFEDAPAGVEAALNAKMNVVWIPDKNLKVDSELANRCVLVLDSMEGFDVDGIDQNLLVLFHGLGDTADNFIKFGLKMRIPQTALLSIQGTVEIPFFPDGWAWFPSFDDDGFTLKDNDPRLLKGLLQTRTKLLTFFKSLEWPLKRIFLLGYGHGGSVALDLVLNGQLDIGGVISLGGFPIIYQTSKIPIFISYGSNQDNIQAVESLNQSNITLYKVQGRALEMPKEAQEVKEIYEFISKLLSLRNLALENHPDIIKLN